MVTEARAIVATWLPAPCGQCRKPVALDDDWVVGHTLARVTHPELTLDPTNWRPEHRACSDKTGQAAVIAKAKQDALRSVGMSDFPRSGAGGEPPPLPVSLPAVEDRWTVPARLRWAHHVRTAPDWLAPYLRVPGDASPPLAMTEVHPLAVCSFAAESCTHAWRGVPFLVEPSAIAWVEQKLGIRLRWWQRLAMLRQLEHDAAGRLVWRTVVESGTRRIGKSVRLRSIALWRLEHGVRLFEPGQTVIHFGRKLDVVREVQEQAWPWCEAQGWAVTRNNNARGVTHPNGARWLAKTSAYGFDVHLGLADECWDIEPSRISDDLEPAALERESSQVALTSTSHQLATPLMKRRISAAMASDDGRTLLLLWGVEPGADIESPATWKAASAHWSQDRKEQMAATLAEAQEAEPTLAEPDPVGAWACQYLNVWDLVARKKVKGEQVVTAESWGELREELPLEDVPASVAVESWFGDGISVALGWRSGARAAVTVQDHPTLEAAAAAVSATGYRGVVLVGSSLATDPALAGLRLQPMTQSPSAAVAELMRLLGEDAVRHDGDEHLSGQVLGVRTEPGTGGIRLTSRSRVDAVKAAVWVISRSRLAGSGKPRIVTARRRASA
ncbi:hypothetical protein GCM10027596_26760 [Nocardioides korecus]